MRIGITGGIGSGKSSVVSYLRDKYAFVVIDADSVAREVMNELRSEILLLDMACEWSSGREIDRSKLFWAMLNDAQLKSKVEEAMHPLIIAKMKAEVRENKHKNVLLEVPLLFELGLQNMCDEVILVTCDTELRVQRVMQRSGYDEQLVRKIIAAQVSTRWARQMADFVIDNTESQEILYADVDRVISAILRGGN